jgi:hypothetical protein
MIATMRVSCAAETCDKTKQKVGSVCSLRGPVGRQRTCLHEQEASRDVGGEADN